MKNIKYVGLDVHKEVTVIAVLNEAGQMESLMKIKTRTQNFRDALSGLSGTLHLVLEEGSWSAWLYRLLKPLATSVTVCETRHNQLIGAGHKSDEQDACNLARLLRLGSLKAVYKGGAELAQLRELFQAYDNLVRDTTRAQNRLKALYRARGLECRGRMVLRADQRETWLARLPEETARFRAQLLLTQLDTLQELRKQAKKQLLTACQAYPDFARLQQLPGFGAVRAATVLALVGTPQRFRTKRQFWPYCGFAVITHSSADYTELHGVLVKKNKKAATRGLNRNHHPQLKAVFKGAALSALRDETFRAYYDRLIQAGTKPELARLSVARKLAAIALTIWQRQEDYDPEKVCASA